MLALDTENTEGQGRCPCPSVYIKFLGKTAVYHPSSIHFHHLGFAKIKVESKILQSSQSDQFSMYWRSSWMRLLMLG